MIVSNCNKSVNKKHLFLMGPTVMSSHPLPVNNGEITETAANTTMV